jgi:hypothetical protein
LVYCKTIFARVSAMDTVEHITQAYRCWEVLTKFTKFYPRGSKKCIELLWKSVIYVAALDGHKDPTARSRRPPCLSAIAFGERLCKPAWKARSKWRTNRTEICEKETDDKRLKHECRKWVNVAVELRPNAISRIYDVNITLSAVGVVWDEKFINRRVYRNLQGLAQLASINLTFMKSCIVIQLWK